MPLAAACAWLADDRPTRAAELQVDHVIHITVDGLRGSVIEQLGESDLPNFYRMRAEGAYTDNARTLREVTVTMPNHVSMISGRPRDGAAGHGVSRNSDPGNPAVTIHADKGAYVPSVFDVVHDNDLSTAFYAGWSGFNFINNSYNAVAGAPDTTGVDNGSDKIDAYNLRTNDDLQAQTTDLLNDLAADPYAYTLIHMHRIDAMGHGFGWTSPQYLDAVRQTDVQIGRIMDYVNGRRALAANTAIILTADHGGSGTGHGDIDNPEIYRIPFYVWVAGEQLGGELYNLNPGTRADPGLQAPDYNAALQPIRNGDSGNLALDLLGLGPVPGSIINGGQNLRLQHGPIEFDSLVLLVDPTTGDVQLRNQSGSEVALEGYTLRSPSNSLDPSQWDSLDELDGEGGWRESNVSPGQLAELLQSGVFTLPDDEVLRFGAVFNAQSGEEDLAFEYLPPGQSRGIAVPVIYAVLPKDPDFDGDGFVDGADLLAWQRSVGATGLGAPADGDGNGMVDADDLQLWRESFGADVGAASVSRHVNPVPEPAHLGLLFILMLGICGAADLQRRGDRRNRG